MNRPHRGRINHRKPNKTKEENYPGKPIFQAISAYGPKIQTNQTVGLKEAVRFITMRTSMNPSEASAMLQELSACVLFFNNQGTPLKLPGLGILAPSVNRHGERKINTRVDSALKRGINNDEEFNARMQNKNNSGLSDENYKALWNADHPNDPLEIQTLRFALKPERPTTQWQGVCKKRSPGFPTARRFYFLGITSS